MKIRVQIDNETYEVEVGDLTTRPILAVVDGETFEIYPEELAAPAGAVASPATVRPARQAAAAAPQRSMPEITPSVPASDCAPHPAAAKVEKVVTAPIPGVILSVAVKPGDKVEFGQEMCVLEAMKMKNAIRASRAGVIAAVHVAIGDSVRHGQPLVEFES